jgi:hypothetical protein
MAAQEQIHANGIARAEAARDGVEVDAEALTRNVQIAMDKATARDDENRWRLWMFLIGILLALYVHATIFPVSHKTETAPSAREARPSHGQRFPIGSVPFSSWLLRQWSPIWQCSGTEACLCGPIGCRNEPSTGGHAGRGQGRIRGQPPPAGPLAAPYDRPGGIDEKNDRAQGDGAGGIAR